MDTSTTTAAQVVTEVAQQGIGNDIWIMILTSVIGTVTTIAAIIVGNFVLSKNAKDQITYEAITKQRIVWLEVIRNEIADFVASARLYYMKKIVNLGNAMKDSATKADANELYGMLEHMIELSIRIRLRMNPTEDAKLIAAVRDLELKAINDFNFSSEVLTEKIEEVVGLAKIMLKSEWEKVKQEAKHLKFDIR